MKQEPLEYAQKVYLIKKDLPAENSSVKMEDLSSSIKLKKIKNSRFRFHLSQLNAIIPEIIKIVPVIPNGVTFCSNIIYTNNNVNNG